ncbi:MAG: hypothetical protein K5739_05280 [Lachnospiraceae bacterium]|nr:hypothetical protein [Lachnospiraceae bacterium]
MITDVKNNNCSIKADKQSMKGRRHENDDSMQNGGGEQYAMYDTDYIPGDLHGTGHICRMFVPY